MYAVHALQMTVATSFNHTLVLSGTNMVGGHSIGLTHGITLVKMSYVIYINCMYDIPESPLKHSKNTHLISFIFSRSATTHLKMGC